MRFAFLWPTSSGYFDACLRALVAEGHAVYLAHEASTADAPFDDDGFGAVVDRYRYEGQADPDRLCADLDAFDPEVVVAVSWHRPAFRTALRHRRGRSLRVLFMDNWWRGTAKQWGGRLVAPVHVRPHYEAVFLPGERQAAFARMLGFADEQIWQGAYVGDNDAFDRGPRHGDPPPTLLLCARLVEDKGVGDLADAWRQATADGRTAGWRLRVAGVGPDADRLARLDGVDMLGFVQPAELPAVFADSGALVLPSRFEHWGVVVNEACASGLPVIATTAVGATTGLLRDGVNGWLVPPSRPDLLAGRIGDLAALPGDRWREMAERSQALASSYTPRLWARYLADQSRRALAGARS